tara:strand:+ start:30205 stop:31767 length:1563 start_codon:yes stop_codon:yes gene_type:complete
MAGYAKEKIEEFMTRQMRDIEQVKQVPLGQVDAALEEAGFSPPCPLWEHQKRCALLATRIPGLVLLLGCGMGKTRTAASIFDWHLSKGTAERCLMVTPFSTVVGEWRREMENFPSINFVGLDGTAKENKERWDDPTPNMVGCTVAMFLQRVGAAKNSKVDQHAAIEKLVEDYDMIIFDESSYMRRSNTVIYKTLSKVMDAIPVRLMLTGTPMNGKPEDLWPQFRLVDGGYTLGETISLYRQAMFKETKQKFGRGRTRVDYHFKPQHTEHLHERIKNVSIRYDAKEMGEMPDMLGGLAGGQFIKRVGLLPDSTQRIYGNLLEEIRKAKGDQEQIENTYLRMRQVVAGYVTMPDELEKIQIKFPKNPKLDLLDDTLDQMPPGDKTLVACWFKGTADVICERLEKKKRKFCRIDGDTPNSLRQQYLHDFRHTDKYDIIVGTLAIGYGVNLPEAKAIVFYETPDSQIDRHQMEHRVLRGDSTHSPTCLELVIAGSVDETILANLQNKEKVNAAVLRGMLLGEGQ